MISFGFGVLVQARWRCSCYADDLDLAETLTQVADTARQAGKMTVLEVSDEDQGDEPDGVASATLTSSRRPDIDTVLLMNNREGSWCLVSMSACPLADDSTNSWLTPDFSGCRNRPGRGR